MHFSLRSTGSGASNAARRAEGVPDSFWSNTPDPSSDLVSIGASVTTTPLTPAHHRARVVAGETITLGSWRVRL
jgi:hypothetical protein